MDSFLIDLQLLRGIEDNSCRNRKYCGGPLKFPHFLLVSFFVVQKYNNHFSEKKWRFIHNLTNFSL